MKRLNLDGRMFERDNGDYILFTDHEAAIKQAKTIGYAQGYEDGFTDGDQDTYLSSYKEPK